MRGIGLSSGKFEKLKNPLTPHQVRKESTGPSMGRKQKPLWSGPLPTMEVRREAHPTPLNQCLWVLLLAHPRAYLLSQMVRVRLPRTPQLTLGAWVVPKESPVL